MFRDDLAAMAEQNAQLRREADRLRAENEAMRAALTHHRVTAADAWRQQSVYDTQGAALTEGERVAFARHALRPFRPWLAVLLHVLTFGVWSIAHFGRMHGALPKLRGDDPGTARAILFFFVPYLNLWWAFFSPLRLVDRINLQFALRGRAAPLTKVPVVVGAVVTFFLYFFPIAWVYAVWQTQRAVNDLVALGDVTPAVEREAATGVRVDTDDLFGEVPAEHHAPVEPTARATAAR